MSVDMERIIKFKPLEVSLLSVVMVAFMAGSLWVGYESSLKTISGNTKALNKVSSVVSQVQSDRARDHDVIARIDTNQKIVINHVNDMDKQIVNVDTRLKNVESVVNK